MLHNRPLRPLKCQSLVFFANASMKWKLLEDFGKYSDIRGFGIFLRTGVAPSRSSLYQNRFSADSKYESYRLYILLVRFNTVGFTRAEFLLSQFVTRLNISIFIFVQI